jgi:3-oxoacyl-[acyl-carrier protein] reductase
MKKTALITGASRGIGAAAAYALALDGYDVIVNYRENHEAARIVAEKTGGRAVCADVSDVDAVTRMFDGAGVDLLVCNAGISLTGLFTDTATDWRRVFDTNVGGVINCCNAAIPHMVRQKSGCIITLSSIWGITGASCEALYSASKAAVIGLTKSLAKELAPSGIRVNCVAPGVIDTDMNASLSPRDVQSLRDETPLGVVGTPEDVASVISFLASDGAKFITGQVISPNGGILC